MIRRILVVFVGVVGLALAGDIDQACGQQAYGQGWGRTHNTRDWNRYYHYPFVYYPQNFWGGEYYRSSESMYHRYPPEMRIPVYNKRWHNYYPAAAAGFKNGRDLHRQSGLRYHSGHHFVLDVF